MERSAIVLSGGGVRGAYQVGVIDGIVDVLGLHGAAGPPLFNIFAGASIGAINSAYLAANANRADHAIDGLVKAWREIEIDQTLRFTPLGLWGWPRLRWPSRHDHRHGSPYVGRSLFDPRPIEALLERTIAWDRLHANVRACLVRTLVVAALDIFDDRTTLFTELAPGARFRPDTSHAHRTIFTPVTAERVLASTALPFVFPARSLDGRYYMDGALHFTTPILPALRADAERLVVISLLHQPHGPEPEGPLEYPGFMLLLGKILSALLLDPVLHDVENLVQTNRIFEVVAETVDPLALDNVARGLESARVVPTRVIPTLVFRPSEDIAVLTADFLREELTTRNLSPIRRLLRHRATRSEAGHKEQLASILLFDGRLAARLIDLGRRDAQAARERILAFFECG